MFWPSAREQNSPDFLFSSPMQSLIACRVCSVSSNRTGRPVFSCWIANSVSGMAVLAKCWYRSAGRPADTNKYRRRSRYARTDANVPATISLIFQEKRSPANIRKHDVVPRGGAALARQLVDEIMQLFRQTRAIPTVIPTVQLAPGGLVRSPAGALASLGRPLRGLLTMSDMTA